MVDKPLIQRKARAAETVGSPQELLNCPPGVINGAFSPCSQPFFPESLLWTEALHALGLWVTPLGDSVPRLPRRIFAAAKHLHRKPRSECTHGQRQPETASKVVVCESQKKYAADLKRGAS